ncbi:Cof-type HAD-IIB family hydrolase [uncultured Lactobacillus sp.]|uniref:Cof-type HAD-IIB family hydrolase n=1 Tax=uncultured Lactobacillus sp. TaxID=153152 RepID=UPI002623C6DD|nr:Cof-type HAD-IIB family hydrolase [uncultured Lactobacillus sp.]
MIKLVALDTDGTLLNSQNKILDSTKEVIKKALAQGVKIVLCSGRPFAGLEPYMRKLGITAKDQYVVTLNGAITRNAEGKLLTQDLVTNDQYRRLTKFAKEEKVPFNIVDPDSRIITCDRDVDYFELLHAWENTAGMLIRQPDDFPKSFEVSKGCFVGEADLLDKVEPKLHQKFGGELYIVRADDHFLEVLNPKVNKGNGLVELGQKIGISPDEMMAVGDERNDISMFKVASVSVVMGNGSDQAKRYADYVTGSNDEDGIKQAFEKYVLK